MTRILLSKISSACLWICLFILITSSCAKKQIHVSENSAKGAVTSTQSAGSRQKDAPEQAKNDAAGNPGNPQACGTTHQKSEIQVEPSVSHSIFFEFDRWNLDPEAQGLLEETAAQLRRRIDFCLRIDGHCDERGSVAYNLALGEKRAQTAKAFLVSLGIAANRIAIFSYGEERPDDPRHVPEAWAKNRRDELKFIR